MEVLTLHTTPFFTTAREDALRLVEFGTPVISPCPWLAGFPAPSSRSTTLTARPAQQFLASLPPLCYGPAP